MNINAGIDNAIKMNNMFVSSNNYKTKLLIAPGTIALEVDYEPINYHMCYLFNDDGTYKGYRDVYLR